jgi:hypothetical protein
VRLVVALVFAIGCAPADAQRDPGWEVKLPARIDVTLGGSAVVPIEIKLDRGLVVSKDAPVIVELVPEAGVSVKKTRLGRSDAVDPDADAPRFTVPVKGDTGGDHVIKVRVKLWLCGGKVCRPLDVRRQATIAVAAAAPADAGLPPADAGLAVPPDARRRP